MVGGSQARKHRASVSTFSKLLESERVFEPSHSFYLSTTLLYIRYIILNISNIREIHLVHECHLTSDPQWSTLNQTIWGSLQVVFYCAYIYTDSNKFSQRSDRESKSSAQRFLQMLMTALWSEIQFEMAVIIHDRHVDSIKYALRRHRMYLKRMISIYRLSFVNASSTNLRNISNLSAH